MLSFMLHDYIIIYPIYPQKTREEWQVAFFICAAIHVFGGFVYLLFAKTNVQKWAGLPAVTYIVGGALGEDQKMMDSDTRGSAQA